MKKIFFTLILLMMVIKPAFCEQTILFDTNDKNYQKRVLTVGYQILNANKINRRIVFKVSGFRLVNAFAVPLDHSVTLYKGIFNYIENPDELAFIVSHEIAHNLDFYSGYGRRMAMSYCPRSYETKADLIGIDLMVKAGFNPLGAITVSQKIMGEEYWWEFLCSHPKGSKRTAQEYVYIKRKYPQFLDNKMYAQDPYYQNFLLTSEEPVAKVEKKWQPAKDSFISNITKPKSYIPVTNITNKSDKGFIQIEK